ncbi:GntR family transcriptional regulator [Cytobacillus horneckiae]|uniref:GntR family transcriptional regulator n=1 Tax=Cytobacillus horneckiae TaxID=549687 RepID=A0A2N0ZLL0_9BACI|nr:GntR family transcriptional regulator [Cytobacillus horneckiae]MBN6885838.1 GntR family transcriptional regulator [Cytobacillus horneckiae]MCM3177384.1 GntR family transcriptional regulator [Cytobacillus horneckiae]MEC1156052.1 GntR family transcriptional regulator [Cytobacillus horneckiae]MED2937412.1 GntR family transcriptional regulator [Cytobacillus horneckiae]PKG30404.1 GntR family transcriptional regulator [Cytobacillus horneckiae]
MLELDLRSRKPIYEQLVDKIKELIIIEVMKPDEQLPSVRSMAQELAINPNTIQKAYRELENQGYIYSVKGKGSFVSPATPQPDIEKLIQVKKELAKYLSEAMFLGMPSEEIINLIKEIEDSMGGGS